MKNICSILLGFVCAIALLTGCSGNNEQATENGTPKNEAAEIIAETEQSIGEVKTYVLPTPVQVASLLKDRHSAYDPTVLLQKNNVTGTQSENAIMLGQTLINLAYTTINKDKNESLRFLNRTKHLTQSMGLDATPDAALVNAYDQSFHNSDSLPYLLMEAYQNAQAHFQNQQQEGSGVLVLLGCFIEGAHLANSVDGISEEDRNGLLAQNKIFYSNISDIVSYFEYDPQIEAMLKDFVAMGMYFDQVEIDFVENAEGNIERIQSKASDSTQTEIKMAIGRIRNAIAARG